MTNNIHTTAVISNKAQIGKNVSIGPYCVIGDNVKIGDNTKLLSHVVVEGYTTIGSNSIIYPFACIGHAPQDLKYSGEKSEVIIGKGNTIREYVTINPGTQGGGMLTKIGDNCLLMVGVHIAHDCILGNHVIMANNATLAGHVKIGDFAILGGLSAVHQFVRIGHHAMIGGMSGIENDVIPYGQASGERAYLVGLNLVGLKRRQFDRENIHILRNAYRMIFSPEGTLEERVEDTRKMFPDYKEVIEIVDFIQNGSNRSVCQPKNVNLKNNQDS